MQVSANGSFTGNGTITGVRFPGGAVGPSPAVPLPARQRIECPCCRTPAVTPSEGPAPSGAQRPPSRVPAQGPPSPLASPGVELACRSVRKWNHSSTQKALFAANAVRGLGRGPPRSGCPATYLRLGCSGPAPNQATAGATLMAEPIEVRQPLAQVRRTRLRMRYRPGRRAGHGQPAELMPPIAHKTLFAPAPTYTQIPPLEEKEPCASLEVISLMPPFAQKVP